MLWRNIIAFRLKISLQYKAFLIFAGLVFVFNLLVLNDFLTVLAGAEAENIFQAQQNLKGNSAQLNPVFQLPRLLLDFNYSELGFDLFPLRLPNVFLMILTFLGTFWWGKRLFGQSTIFLMLLIVASTFLIVTIAKFAAFDIWLLAFQVTSFLALVILLKSPGWKWRILFWVSTLGAILVDSQSALIFSFGMFLFLVLFHPNGKKMVQVFDVVFWIGVVVIAFFNGGVISKGEGLYFHFSRLSLKDYFLFQTIAFLPWLAFLPASLLDTFQKMRKREEMAIILFSFLIFSVLSGGLVLQFAFALLVAKQIENYFKPNYPHANLVKIWGVINLGFSFLIVAILLLTGYESFSEIGFRSKMGTGAVFWAFSFLSIIGLFGKNRKMIVGSMALCGMLTMLLFWAQIAPLLENYRNFPKQLTKEVFEMSDSQNIQIYIDPTVSMLDVHSARLKVYLESKNIDYQLLGDELAKGFDDGIFILSEESYLKIDNKVLEQIEHRSIKKRGIISGKEQQIWILKK